MELEIPLRGKDKPLTLRPRAKRRSPLVQGKQDMEGQGCGGTNNGSLDGAKGKRGLDRGP